MKILYSVPIVLLLLCAPSAGQQATASSDGKSKRELAQEEQLSRLLSKVGVTIDGDATTSNQHQSYRQVKIRWANSKATTSDNAGVSSLAKEGTEQAIRSSIVEEKTHPGTLPRPRSLELSQTQIFIAAVDAKDQLRWWSIAPDPRIVRAETETSTGELRSHDYYLNDITLVVAYPDDPEIVSLRFYHPSWNGTGFDLQLLAATPTR